jgi:non-canonical (house-cleaning) NTP pyrophosphatase
MAVNQLKFVIATNNSLKIRALQDVLKQKEIIPKEILSFNESSNVRDAPYDEEISIGAQNRVKNLRRIIESDVYVGLETGIVRRHGGVYIETWCFIHYKACYFSGYSMGVEIPREYVRDIWDKTNRELCDWVDARSDKQDLVHYFTDKKINRYDTFKSALISALTVASII